MVLAQSLPKLARPLGWIVLEQVSYEFGAVLNIV